MKQLERWDYFQSSVYSVDVPEFLDSVNEVSEHYLEIKRKESKLNENYPCYMTENYFDNEKIKEFQNYVGLTSWNILDAQGFAMDDYVTYFLEMWSQEHYKHSFMEKHIHGNGSQIIGFYFLDCPKDCSKLVLHDPRTGKIQIDLPLKNEQEISLGNNAINFQPKAGQLILTNSWLAHSITKNLSDSPIKFVHFSIAVQKMPQKCDVPSAEVI